VALLRKEEDLGRPYINCAGLPKQWETLKKTEAMLDNAGQEANAAQSKGREQAISFAKDEIKGAATDYVNKIHAVDKGLSLAMKKTGLNHQQRKALFELKEQLEKTKKRAESMAGLGGPVGAFAFRALKTDIDLTALAVSQGLSEKEPAVHREAQRVLKDQLSRTEGTVKFLEKEGTAQCP